MKPTIFDRNRLIKDYEKHFMDIHSPGYSMTVSEIAKKNNIKVSSAFDIIKEYWNSSPEFRREKSCYLYEVESLSIKQISKLLKIPQPTLYMGK